MSAPPSPRPHRLPSFLGRVGPGVVTGAADDDPSGIATDTQAGAQFGTGVLWTVFLTIPFMIGIQLVSARIGRQSGHGIAANLRRHMPRPFLFAIVGLLLVANTINIAVDIAAMGQALRLVVGGGAHFHAVGFGLLTLLLQVFVPYRRLAPVLKWLTLSLFVYVAAAFTVRIPWAQVLHDLVLPQIVPTAAFWMTIVAIFGTTISPYLFFWQAAQDIEEMQLHGVKAGHERLETLRRAKHRMWLDTGIGMLFSNGVAFFVMLMGAVVLHAAGIIDVRSAAQAAQTLRPLAGDFAFALFALGIIATLVGTGLIFTPIEPMRALVWSAVINGVVSVPIMVAMLLLASDTTVMGGLPVRRRTRLLGWGAVLLMAWGWWH